MLDFISQAFGLLFLTSFMVATVAYCYAVLKHGDDEEH
jgi:cbb3-type cytochrome oxidase subunit 3